MEKEAIKIAEHVKSFGSRPESVEKRMDLQKLNDMKSLQQTMENTTVTKAHTFHNGEKIWKTCASTSIQASP